MKRTIFTTIIISIIMTTISTAIINAEMLKNKAVVTSYSEPRRIS